MNYLASIQDFFKSPKWMTNLLLAALCALIPLVGPLVVMGWLITGFWGRSEDRAETFPDFNFDKFGKYLERGLWPFLVSMVAGVIAAPVMLVGAFVSMAIITGAASGGNEEQVGLFAIIGSLVMAGGMFVVMLVVMFLVSPVILRATLLQDFAPAFNLAFVKRFLGLVKMELALSLLFMGAAGVAFMVVGMVPCLGVLVILALVPLVYYAWMHLQKQLYQLYLSRGGEPVPLSPKLTDAPPSVPLA